MPVELVSEAMVTVGVPATIEGPSPRSSFAVVFEDDGVTGYFYGLDFAGKENPILDAMHVYNVAQVTDRDKPSLVQLVWSSDGLKSALLINQYPYSGPHCLGQGGPTGWSVGRCAIGRRGLGCGADPVYNRWPEFPNAGISPRLTQTSILPHPGPWLISNSIVPAGLLDWTSHDGTTIHAPGFSIRSHLR